MSYCRWSSDSFKCDLYAYESDEGFVIHVASYKIIGEVPKVDINLILGEDKNMEEYLRQSKISSEWMESCKREPIGLPFDGESFTLDTEEEMYAKMIELKNIGYRVPDYITKLLQP